MTTRFDLPAGAVGYVESSTAVPLVSIVVSLRSGGTGDPVGKDGLCRFTGRMLRRGCKGLDSQAIEEAIDRLGGELGLDVGFSTASLHGQVIRRNLDAYVDLLVRIIGTPAFDDAEIARLRRESVAELIESRDSDRALGNIALRRALFGAHPYARSSAGRTSTVDTITTEDVRATYARQFVRSDVVIGFAGAITTEEAKALGEKLVLAFPEGPHVDADPPEPSPVTGRRLVFVDKPDRSQTPILLGTLGTRPQDADHIPLVIATAVLGGTFTSRMMREIRSKRGWSYGTAARLSIERRRHAFTMSAAPGSADCGPCLALEIDMLGEFVEKGVTQKELGFIKNYLVRSHAFEVDTAPKRLGQALETELLGLPGDYHSAYVEHVKGATLEHANAAIKERLTAKDFVAVVVGTASETLDKVKASIPDLGEVEVVPFDRD